MDKNNARKQIGKPNLIICEGTDDILFILQFLEYLKKTDVLPINHNFQAFECGGNDGLAKFLKGLPNYPGYDYVKSIIIIRDAEKDHERAMQEIKRHLENSGFPIPAKPREIAAGTTRHELPKNILVAFSLFPTLSDKPENGTIEDLLIKNLKHQRADDLVAEINTFMEKLQSDGRIFTWPHKSRLHTYFSLENDFVSKKIGEAAKANAFNFDCEAMNYLKDLLLDISARA